MFKRSKTFLIIIILCANINIHAENCNNELNRGEKLSIINDVNQIRHITPVQDGKSLHEIEGISLQDILNFNLNNGEIKVKAIVFQAERSELSTIDDLVGNTVVVNHLKTSEKIPVLVNSISKSFEDRLSFLNEMQRSKILKDISEASDELEVYTLNYDEKTIGLLAFRNFRHDSTLKTLVSWIWIENNLGIEIKAEAKYLILRILFEKSLPTLIASIHTANHRSMLFFSKIGFKPKWLYVE